jgi:MFS family permease
MISTVLSKHLVDLGMTVTVAGIIIGAMPMASMLIRPVSGFICDHFSKKRLLILFLSLNCICVFGYGIVSSEEEYLILRSLHGISFGITTTITMALISDYIPEGRMSEGLGYFSLTLTLAMAVGPAIGLAISKFAGSHTMFLFAGICVCLSVCSSFFLKEEVYEQHHNGKKL